MPVRGWRIRVQDILGSIARIERYIAEITFEDFTSDDKTIDAVIRNLEIIGEAANHVPVYVQEQYPEIPWKQAREMRNVLIHGYFGIDLSIVWRTVHHNLPPLAAQLQQILNDDL